MAVNKLTKDIQILITASIKINSFKTAVEELVYNALDADSTSIAIRVNIEANTIQVIDNGCGISEKDFPLLGQRHATSKCVDLATLKSVPSKYGYRGQFLSSLIEVSKSVKITSKAQDSEQTFCKCYDDGRETEWSVTTRRPSKGTTVEVKGFLYNMTIRKKSINALQELRDIKTFLEQLSLVHSNISISLRDDSSNDIIFKLHKNRDIYQTLSTLFEVEKAHLQELTVEKKQYKVVAYIGKMDSDIRSKQFIYLNGKLTHNSTIYKRVNDQLGKILHLKFQTRRKVKSKVIRENQLKFNRGLVDLKNVYCLIQRVFNEDENVPSDGEIPFYVILITCPYYDYDMSYTPKHSMLEFKNWDHVNKLLEKLVKFYAGDLNLKEVKNQNNIPKPNDPKVEETRDKVRKIVEKMLGNTMRKPGVSQMNHGVKGKLIKRKRKNQNSVIEKDISLSKIMSRKKQKRHHVGREDNNQENFATDKGDISHPVFSSLPSPPLPRVASNINVISKCTKKKGKLKLKKASPYAKTKTDKEITELQNTRKKDLHGEANAQKRVESVTVNSKNLSRSKINKTKNKALDKQVTRTKIPTNNKVIDKPNAEINKLVTVHDPIIEKFEKQTLSVKKKCEVLARNVEDLLINRKKSDREVFVNETVQYSNFIHNYHNISIQQRVEEYIVHESASRPINDSPCTFDNRNWNDLQINVRTTTYDLLHTILTTQTKDNVQKDMDNQKQQRNTHLTKSLKGLKYFIESSNSLSKEVNMDFEEQEQVKRKLTYESHHYGQVETNYSENSDFHYNNVREQTRNFITTNSREFFEANDRKSHLRQNFKLGFRNKFRFQYNPYSKRRTLINGFKRDGKCAWNHEIDYSDYTIEFSKSKERIIHNVYTDINPTTKNQQAKSRSTDTYISPDFEQYATYTIIEESSNNGNKEINAEVCESQLTSRTSQQICLNYPHNHTQNVEDPIASYRTHCDQNYINDNGEDCEKYTNNQGVDVTVFDRSKINQYKETETSNGGAKSIRVVSCSEEKNNADQEIDPLNVCVTVHRQDQLDENPGVVQQPCNDSLFNDDFDLESFLFDRNIYMPISINSNKAIETCNAVDEIEHNILSEAPRNAKGNDEKHVTSKPVHEIDKMTEPTKKTEIECKENRSKNFNFRNRPRFVPKGLSPIFENCHTKTVGSTFVMDQYEDRIYNDFAANVQANTGIFEPRIQNVKELTTRDIEKVNSRLHKNNASLIFDGECLKNILVLGQVDDKFIAAKIKGKTQHEPPIVNESLVLFDQHAVHERIRLEKNLSEYFNGEQWKSIALDEVTVKLSQDDLVYLHNYKDKFKLFGLQWTITDHCKVAITAIPEALLGKNPRKVDVIVKALKNLIAEEISAIKSQKGCVTLHPKSIMDLVFSEACRYAIKFGDRLSKSQCRELLDALSECKTPFQCAHGRPVMAVLIDIQKGKREYKVNPSKLLKFFKILKK